MLELINVCKTFNPGTVNAKTALNDLNLTLNDGDFVTVIGGNGAGKSTMLNAIAGSFQIDSGKIVIDGTDVTGLPVEVIDTAELGALGCAMAAAVMAGDYPDLRAAADGMVRVRERVESDLEKTAAYREKLAEATARGICSFLGVAWTEEPSGGVAEWAEEAWEKATEKGVMDGTRPTDPVTRQELAVVLDRLGLI